MNHRPLIGINADFRVSPKHQGSYTLMHSGYYDCLLTANALPVVIPPFTRESELIPILEKLDAVMLTGGDDLDPKKMGLTPHPSVTMMSERRETADRLLCKLVQQRRVPTLGVGVGMQELNVVCGGGLFVHLPEDMPKCIPHYDPHGGAHRHTVVMQPKHAARRDLWPGRDPRQQLSPSGRSQACPQFPRRRPRARRSDRGFEGKDPSWWVVGVQWHPENEGHISLDMQLIEAFVEAAGASSNVPALAKVG